MIFDALGGMGDMVKKARNMQSELKRVKDELKDIEVEENTGGVKVIVSGDLQLKEFKIEQSVLENDKDRIEYLIGDAFSKAYSKARDEATGKLKKVAGGLSIPGLM